MIGAMRARWRVACVLETGDMTPTMPNRAASARRLAPRPRRPHGAVRRLCRCRSSMKASWPSICGRATSAGLFDVSHMGQLLIAGPRRDEGARSAAPGRSSRRCSDGRLRYSLLLDDDGGILDDLMVTRRGDAFLHGRQRRDQVWRYRPSARASCRDAITLNHMKEQALLALQGPKAVDALARLAPGVDALGFMTGGAVRDRRHRAWISRSGYTGEDGFEISIPRDAARARRRRCCCAQPEVKPIGLGARDSLRLEAGLPLYGHDLDPETTPVEAALGFALSQAPPRGGRLPRRRPDPARARGGRRSASASAC